MSKQSTEQKIEAFVGEILEAMGITANIIVDEVTAESKSYFKVDIEGEQASELIGYHGKTLEALRNILHLAVLNYDKDYGILIDVNGYVAKKEETIRKTVGRAMEQVRLTGLSLSLEPMSPAERRIVHYEVSQADDLASESSGDEPERYVIIKPRS